MKAAGDDGEEKRYDCDVIDVEQNADEQEQLSVEGAVLDIASSETDVVTDRTPTPEQVVATNDLITWAAYCRTELGLHAIPLYPIVAGRCSCGDPNCGRSSGKHPQISDFAAVAEMPDEEYLGMWAAYPGANVGFLTGPASNLLVLDIDRHGNDDGPESLRKLEEKYGPLPPTVTVISGGGGEHRYFTYPEGCELTVGAGFNPGLDFRGARGYIVGPPSFHISGEYYRFKEQCSLEEIAIAAPPTWLVKEMQASKADEKKKRDRVRDDEKQPVDEMPAAYLEGTRNVSLTREAGRLRRNGLDEAHLRDELLAINQKKCRPPLDGNEVARIAASIAKHDAGVGNDCEVVEDTRPVIDSQIRDLSKLTDKALDVLRRANDENPTLFSFAQRPSRLGEKGIEAMGPKALRGHLARVARWHKRKAEKKGEEKKGKVEWVDDLPPMHVVEDILSLPTVPLPTLNALVSVPCVTRDGRVLHEHGYDWASGLYLTGPTRPMNERILRPSQEQATLSLRFVIHEVLSDFPFASDADKANAAALLVGLVARDLISGQTPLHMYDKPTPRTGASLCVSAITLLATGTVAKVNTWPSADEEVKKLITSNLAQSKQVILFDNVTRLKSPHLAAVLTSDVWEDRPFGFNDRTVSYPNRSFWVATANNPKLSDEIAERTIHVRMDAQMENPGHRDTTKFKHPELLEWVKSHQDLLRDHVIAAVMAWVSAGKPAYTGPSLGGFENWGRVVGGILNYCGVTGFLENRDSFLDACDDDSPMWRGFVLQWWKDFKDAEVNARALREIAEKHLPLGDGGDQSKATILGQLLKSKQDRVFDGYRIVQTRERRRALGWKLLDVDNERSNPPTV